MAYNDETGLYEGYIYKIWNDVNDRIYIGRTMQTLSERFSKHLSLSKSYAKKNSKKRPLLYSEIEVIGKEHFHICIINKIYANTKIELNDKLNQYEIKTIAEYKEKGMNLLNMADGGNHIKDGYFNKPIIQYDFNGNIMNRYNTLTDASSMTGISLASISQCCSRINHVAGNYIWRYEDDPDVYEEELKIIDEKFPNGNNQHGIKVDQYDINMNLINSYSSILEASRMTGINASSIANNCKGYAKSVGGYIWKYNNIILKPYIKPAKRSCASQGIPIIQINPDTNEIVKIYQKASEVKEALKIKSIGNINACCNGFRKKAYGFIWKYIEE